MYPTFKNKEYILTNLIALRFQEPRRGDVIVFHAPPDPEKDFIKRVMALPGDTVALKNGSVYVNNSKLDESPYLKPDVKTYGGSFLKEDMTIKVPDGDYIVMGDNRPFSSDSREWGFLPKEKIIGESMFVYWPVNAMRIVKNPF
jgi:signal peptidase I